MQSSLIHRAASRITQRWLTQQARALTRRCLGSQAIEAALVEVLANPWFRPIQKPTEILGLLKMIEPMQPRRLCEIGTAAGGTLLLLGLVAGADASLLSIDVAYTKARMEAYQAFARAGQRICCLAGDSHAADTLLHVERWLGREQLDVLFIDGDHSLDGVRNDFQAYSRYVRPGGVIAVHDIVPDFRARFGIATSSEVGQVPEFWNSVKHRYDAEQFVEDPEQDGFGIGIVHWNPGGADVSWSHA
jgi:predicted O-methyltransferase YrrM